MRKIIRFLKRNNISSNDHLDDIVKKVYQEFNHDIEISDIWNIVSSYLYDLEDSDASYQSIEIEEDIMDPRKEKWLTRIEELKRKPQPEQRSNDWYEMRKNMFTASSDIANILGLGYEKGPAVYKHLMLKKNGHDLKGFRGNEATRWGQKYEDIICAVYCQRNKTEVKEYGLIQHDTYPFIGASPDGISSDGIMLEIKCPFRRQITGTPKTYYWVQMQCQLEVCDLDLCDFCECTINEYPDEEAFLQDVLLEDENKTQMDLEKGIIGEYYNKYLPQDDPDNVKFVYPPLYLSPLEKKKWIHQQSIAGFVFRRFIYWKIDVYSCIRIERDHQWWSDALPKIENAWKDVLSYRNNPEELAKLLKKMQRGKEECMIMD